MSIEDLKNLGVTELKEDSNTPASTRVGRQVFLATAFLGIVGCVLIGLGDGSLWTWMGLMVFAIGFGLFIIVNLRGIDSD